MSYNPSTTTSYYYVDQLNDMMLRQPHPWAHDEHGEGDAIGRSFEAYYTWNQFRFVTGIRRCFKYENGHWQGYRYPTGEHKGISRDHISYALIAFKHSGHPFLEELIYGLRWKISDFASFTPDMWCWMKSLEGSKFWQFLYYSMEIPVTIINVLRNKYIYWRAGFKEEISQDEWVIGNYNNKKTSNKWSKKLFQVFAMHNLAWQLKVLPDCMAKKFMQRLVLKMVPKHNGTVVWVCAALQFSINDDTSYKL